MVRLVLPYCATLVIVDYSDPFLVSIIIERFIISSSCYFLLNCITSNKYSKTFMSIIRSSELMKMEHCSCEQNAS